MKKYGHYARLSKELQAFKGCHNRVRDGKSPSISYERNLRGFLHWLADIGPIPTDMIKPSVGRINHDFGYQPGNMQWEEHRFNSVKRQGTKFARETSNVVQLRVLKFKKGSPEHLMHQRTASLKRWSDPKQRDAARKRMIGNKRGAKK
jgi:hypothetical protein